MADAALIARIERRCVRGGACLLWQGALLPNGYGKITVGSTRDGTRATVGVHRAMWVAVAGPIPASLCVLHTCDTPICVERTHLFLGTHADNAADRDAKGRDDFCPGAVNGMAKLSEDDARKVLALAGAGYRHADIGEAFGVGRTAVSRIASGRRWAHLREVTA